VFKDIYAGIPLAVQLLSFTAELKNGNAELNWVTTAENNPDHYIIERSRDGIHYAETARMDAAPVAGDRSSYRLTDNLLGLNSGKVFYRLQSVSSEGKTQYSDTRTVWLGAKDAGDAGIVAFPNPAQNNINVTTPSSWKSKNVSYEIYSAAGQVVYSKIKNSAAKYESFDITGLAPGFYLVKATCERESSSMKLVKY
jgi:hypothetical protein